MRNCVDKRVQTYVLSILALLLLFAANLQGGGAGCNAANQATLEIDGVAQLTGNLNLVSQGDFLAGHQFLYDTELFIVEVHFFCHADLPFCAAGGPVGLFSGMVMIQHYNDTP